MFLVLLVTTILTLALVVYLFVIPKTSCYTPDDTPSDVAVDDDDDATTSSNVNISNVTANVNADVTYNITTDDPQGVPFSTSGPAPVKMSSVTPAASSTSNFVPVPSDYLANLQAVAAMNANNVQTLNDITHRLNEDAANYLLIGPGKRPGQGAPMTPESAMAVNPLSS